MKSQGYWISAGRTFADHLAFQLVSFGGVDIDSFDEDFPDFLTEDAQRDVEVFSVPARLTAWYRLSIIKEVEEKTPIWRESGIAHDEFLFGVGVAPEYFSIWSHIVFVKKDGWLCDLLTAPGPQVEVVIKGGRA